MIRGSAAFAWHNILLYICKASSQNLYAFLLLFTFRFEQLQYGYEATKCQVSLSWYYLPAVRNFRAVLIFHGIQ